MIITVAGQIGAGKSTCSKLLSARLGMKRFSVGNLMQSIAEEKGMDIMELSRQAENSGDIDRLLDARQVELGKNNDDIIFDSRLGWHFIPHSYKIYLKVGIDTAARRIFEEHRDRERYNKDIATTKRKIIERTESEKKRYMEYYGIDPDKDSNYDLVIDTTDKTPEKIVGIIIDSISGHKN